METEGMEYNFRAKVWRYPSDGWYFISFPKEMSKEIRENFQWLEEGWGRLKARIKIGNSEWKTSIWFDTKRDTYLLPLKAEIRKNENIEIDKDVEAIVWI